MRILLAAALLLPTNLFAAGSDSSTPPPKPTVFCSGSKVYDEKARKCVDPAESRLDVEELYQAVRRLAYADRYEDAQVVLAAMPQDDDRTLTYLGFTHRKLGNIELGMVYYEKAIARNPANILARSYMGQGLVAQGDLEAAIAQLEAIHDHGGKGTWAETSLREAIGSGDTFNY